MTSRPQNKTFEVKSSKGRKRWVKFCPKCGSTNIQWASGLPQFWSIWECKNCGYRGAFVVENGKLAAKIRTARTALNKTEER